MNSTQPTLRGQIRDLEYQLGVPLFHREKNHLYLLPDSIKKRVEELIQLSDNLDRTFVES